MALTAARHAKKKSRIYIYSLRDICKGEKLNYDYRLVLGEGYTKKVKKKSECRCSSPKCRGTILAPKKNSGKKSKKKD